MSTDKVMKVRESTIDYLVTDGAFGMEAHNLLMEMRSVLQKAIDNMPYRRVAMEVLAKVEDYEARWNEERAERRGP